jgi:hypothetical protein
MAITNNNIPVIDLPSWEVLQPLIGGAGAAATPGILVNDKRGTDRYIYYLFSATSFWRYDTYANTYQQLASPPGGTTGAGTCLIYDPSNAYVWALISNGTLAPTWQYYDIAANTWTARSVVNLPATFGTDAALSHPCTTYGAAASDDFIYLIGNNAATFYRYTISANTWVASPTTIANCNSTSGVGCALIWTPGYDVNRIVRMRGTATATFEYYSISANTWNAITVIPATETYTTGSMVASRGITDEIYIQKDATLRIYRLDLGDGTITPVATEFMIATGAALVGDRFVYVKETNGIEFLYLGLHTSANFLRTPIFF